VARFRLTKAAQSDLLQIGRDTYQRWRREQARTYLRAFDACFHQLDDDPTRGPVAPELRSYRRVRQGKHLIYYRIVEQHVVLIVRILHDRMLPSLHLDPSQDSSL